MSKKHQQKTSTPEANTDTDGPTPNHSLSRFVVPIGVCALLLLLAFICTSKILLQPHIVFAFNDGNIESALAPTYQYPEGLIRRWDSQSFFGKGAGSAPLSISNGLNALLGPHGFRREGVLIAIWLTGMAGYWASRLWGRSRSASLLASLLFMLCGWTVSFSTVGLPIRPFTLACAAVSLGWIKQGVRRGGWLPYIVAGGFLGLSVSDTADVGILFSVCCAIVFVFLHLTQVKDALKTGVLVRSACKFLVYAIVSLALAYQTIEHQIGMNIKGVSQGTAQSSEDKYAWATQWSLPKAETWSLFASDYHGASSRSETSPYWGGMGRSQGWEETKQGFRNFRLAGYALGVVPLAFLAILFATIMRRADGRRQYVEDAERNEIWCLMLLMLVTLMLSWGRHFPLYRLFYGLPFMGTIRNPDKWLGPFTLFFVFAFASAVDCVIRIVASQNHDDSRKTFRNGALLAAMIPTIALIGLTALYTGKESFITKLNGQGYGAESTIAWANAVQANIQIIIVLAIMGALLWFYMVRCKAGTPKSTGIMIGCTGLLLVIELMKANGPFIVGHDYLHILRDNPMTSYLDSRKSEGRVKVLPPQNPLLNNWRNTYLTARGYDLFDPVSAPRLPNDYKALFDAMGNDVTRLWGLGAIRFIVCPTQLAPQLQQMSRPGAEFISRLSFGVSQISGGHWVPDAAVPENQKVLSIMEYTGARPFLGLANSWIGFPDNPEGDQEALARLTARDFDWQTEAIVHGSVEPATTRDAGGSVAIARRTPTQTEVVVETARPALLVNAIRYDPHWQVSVDGSPTELLRVNYLFQGIKVPQGRHEILFEYNPPRNPLHIAVAGRLLLLFCLGLAWLSRRKQQA